MTIHLTEEEYGTIMLRAARFCNVPVPHFLKHQGDVRVCRRGEKFNQKGEGQ